MSNRSSVTRRAATIALFALATAGAACSVEPEPGDPPLTGTWLPQRPCGVDISCGFHLRLKDSWISGDYWRGTLGGSSSEPVSGVFAAPAVHLTWDESGFVMAFDGTWRSDSLLVGVLTSPSSAYADTMTLVRRP
jgi:hypothetical protein